MAHGSTARIYRGRKTFRRPWPPGPVLRGGRIDVRRLFREPIALSAYEWVKAGARLEDAATLAEFQAVYRNGIWCSVLEDPETGRLVYGGCPPEDIPSRSREAWRERGRRLLARATRRFALPRIAERAVPRILRTSPPDWIIADAKHSEWESKKRNGSEAE